jgi:hypothetical protein
MLYRTNELQQENQLFASMGRMQDMTQNFQIVEQQQGKSNNPLFETLTFA